jgi:hypothetical protein
VVASHRLAVCPFARLHLLRLLSLNEADTAKPETFRSNFARAG